MGRFEDDQDDLDIENVPLVFALLMMGLVLVASGCTVEHCTTNLIDLQTFTRPTSTAPPCPTTARPS